MTYILRLNVRGFISSTSYTKFREELYERVISFIDEISVKHKIKDNEKLILFMHAYYILCKFPHNRFSIVYNLVLYNDTRKTHPDYHLLLLNDFTLDRILKRVFENNTLQEFKLIKL